MGAWGPSLYDNDFAKDIRGDYVDLLRRGLSSEDATTQLISKNQDILDDIEEAPLFWYSLAETQWSYGRLLPFVQAKALEYIECPEEMERWMDSGEDAVRAWEKTRLELKEKLLSPQPKTKRISRYRFYRCKWNLGDVYAYKFHSEYSREMGIWGKYIIFRKVEEDFSWPGHIVPVVHVYKWIGIELPSIEDLHKLSLLPQKFFPVAYEKHPKWEKEYRLDILISQEKEMPDEHLTYLGNIPGDDLIPYQERGCLSGYARTQWDSFEKKMITQYLAWCATEN